MKASNTPGAKDIHLKDSGMGDIVIKVSDRPGSHPDLIVASIGTDVIRISLGWLEAAGFKGQVIVHKGWFGDPVGQVVFEVGD